MWSGASPGMAKGLFTLEMDEPLYGWMKTLYGPCSLVDCVCIDYVFQANKPHLGYLGHGKYSAHDAICSATELCQVTKLASFNRFILRAAMMGNPTNQRAGADFAGVGMVCLGGWGAPKQQLSPWFRGLDWGGILVTTWTNTMGPRRFYLNCTKQVDTMKTTEIDFLWKH